MDEVKLKAAGIPDIPIISELAKTIWLQYYTSIISLDQINYMLDKMYSTNSLMDQITTKQNRFFLIQFNHENRGFISVAPVTEKEWFLSKFYIDQNFARRGWGQLVFGQMLKIIQPEKLKLTVNRQNIKAINFYFKLGFIIKEAADFDIGAGYFMNDFVMEWTGTMRSDTSKHIL